MIRVQISRTPPPPLEDELNIPLDPADKKTTNIYTLVL